jgi:tetratricopeptide (TPR) repeat protein
LLPLWLHLLALTLPSPALAQAPVAVVPLPAVLQPDEDDPEAPPVAVMVDSVVVRLTPAEETRVEVELRLRALEPGWVDLAVTGGALAISSAKLDGREVALASRDGGARWLTTQLDGEHRLVVTGTVATPAASLDLPLPLASRARVEIAEPGWDLTVDGGVLLADGVVVLSAASRLQARWKPHAAPAPKPRVVTVTSATGVSFDESGLEGRATLRYRVTHGTVEQVSFDIAGAPDSVEVSGAAVRDFTQRGQRVTVRLARPMEGGFELQVAFRAPPPGDAEAHPAPVIKPDGVFEHRGWLTVARADTAMLVPEPKNGLEAVPGSSLPEWATGLVPGTPVVSYGLSGRSQALDYRLLSYDPVAAPPTVVDEARFQLAATAHGRVLMKARYTVRNDRNQYLRLEPPPGFEVLGVRVAGQVRQPVADGDSIYIPLEKSVESLQGLISFPVEVYLLGEEAAWDRKGQRSLRTPAVDAPVAYARWEVWLPTDVEWDELSGLPKHVQDWTTSEHALEYGRAVRDPSMDAVDELSDFGDDQFRNNEIGYRSSRRGNRGRDKDDTKATAASSSSSSYKDDANEDASLEMFNYAYQAYNNNDFDQAQQYLEESLRLDQGNASAQALLGNVQVVTGQAGGEGQADEAQARRVRELARARSVDTELEQKEVQKKAEEALRAGDLEVAERELERLEDMTRDLSRLEQSESVEQQLLLEETAKQLEDTRGKLAKKQKAKAPKVAVSTTPTSGTTTVVGGSYGSNLRGEVVPTTPELIEVPDRYVTLTLEEPQAPPTDQPWPGMDGVEASGTDERVEYGDTDGWPDDPTELAVAEVYEEAEEWADDEPMPAQESEDYWDEDEVYFEDMDIDYAVRPAAMESRSRPARRAAGAVAGVATDAARGLGGLFSRPNEQAQPSYHEVTAAPPPQAAYPAEEGRRVEYQQRTVIDFESVEVEGELTKPQGQLLQDRQQANFAPMIQLRSDFDGELADSLGDVGGSGLSGLDDATAGWQGGGPSEPIVMDFGVQAAGGQPDPSTMEAASRVVTLDSTLTDMAGALDRALRQAERARVTGDVEQLEQLNQRAATIKALHQVTADAAANMLVADAAGDWERSDHERRKILIAQSKVRQVDAEVQAIASGSYDTSGTTVAMVLESDPGPLQGLAAGIGGLIGAKGNQQGSGGQGSRGSGLGGGGTAEGLGGLGTSGRGSGASGYGAGSGRSYQATVDAPPPPPQPEPAPTPEPEPTPVVAFGPAPQAAPAAPDKPMAGRMDSNLAQAHGNAARGPITTARTQETDVAPGGTTALPAPSQTVSAAHLTINIPKAGERLAFEQLLVAENEPMTIDIRYRTRSRK